MSDNPLVDALEDLGKTEGEISAKLKSMGIKGNRSNVFYGPIHNYLRACGLKNVAVGYWVASSYGDDYDHVEYLNEAQVDWIKKFDAGKLPEFVE